MLTGKEYFYSFSAKLFFKVEEETLELLVSFQDSIQEHVDILKGMDLESVPIFYCHEQLSITMDSNSADSAEPESESLETMQSLVGSYVFSNIKLNEKK